MKATRIKLTREESSLAAPPTVLTLNAMEHELLMQACSVADRLLPMNGQARAVLDNLFKALQNAES
jgi:hypothetical protein